MRWVVKESPEGTFLIGSTVMPKEDWAYMSRDEVLKLNETTNVYGVDGGKIVAKGSLKHIAEKYMATMRISGLGKYIKVGVKQPKGTEFEEAIYLQPAESESMPLKVYKVPAFVEIIEGMSWFARKVIFSDSVRYISEGSDEVFLGIGCNTSETEVVLNSSLRGVGSGAFKYSNCSRVSFENNRGTAKFFHKSFEYATNLRDIRFPDGMNMLTSEVFHSCSSLETVYLPDSFEFIADNCFSNCISLTSLWLPDNVRVKSADFISLSPVGFPVRIPVENWAKSDLDLARIWCDRLRFVYMKDCDSARDLLRTMKISRVDHNVFRRLDRPIKPIFVLLEDDSRFGFEEYLRSNGNKYK